MKRSLILALVVLSLSIVPSAFGQNDIDRFDGRIFTALAASPPSKQALAGVMDPNLTPAISIAADGDLWFSSSGVSLGTLLPGVVYRLHSHLFFRPYLRAGLAGYLLSDATHGIHAGGGIEHRFGSGTSLQAEALLLTTQNSNVEIRLGFVFH